eukprot:793946-Prorocentrum_minimum.AAC.2
MEDKKLRRDQSHEGGEHIPGAGTNHAREESIHPVPEPIARGKRAYNRSHKNLDKHSTRLYEHTAQRAYPFGGTSNTWSHGHTLAQPRSQSAMQPPSLLDLTPPEVNDCVGHSRQSQQSQSQLQSQLQSQSISI